VNLFLDVETTTFNKGHPFDPRNFLVSFVVRLGANPPVFGYYTDPNFIQLLSANLRDATTVVGFNIKFDLHWLRNVGIVLPRSCRIWDCQLAEFIYSGQQLPYDSLDKALERYELPRKKDLVKEYWDRGVSTEAIPLPILEEYNLWDVYTTELLFDVQQNLLSDRQKNLVTLEGEDLRTLQSAEYAGIKFDYDKANKLLESFAPTLASIDADLLGLLPADCNRSWFNIDSGDHLSALLYGGTIDFDYSISEEAVYKSGEKKGEAYTRNRWFHTPVKFQQLFVPIEGTEVAKTRGREVETRFYQTDIPTLSQLKAKTPAAKAVVGLLAERSSKFQVVGMLKSIIKTASEKNWQDNLIHGQFNQQVAITGRLSSSAPNLQNTPPEIDELLISRYAD
jgi:DNA polymerase I-like protein with 3'-5' exonuclease and polymerase domains